MDAKTLYMLLFEMLRIRMIEERIIDLYPEKEMRCPVHLSIGQEAIAVGVCQCLGKNDIVLSNHRSHGHYLAKGGDLKTMIAEIYGKATGCSRGRGGSMHLIDRSVNFHGASSIVGSTIPIAVGTAFGNVMQKKKALAVVFFGDAAIEEGVFHESVNFSSLKRLPVLFVCENNFYSVHSHISVRQPKREIYEIGKGHDITSYQDDGMDVLKVYKLAKKAIDEIERNGGPVFIELKTYRYREHCGPNYDFNLGFRTESEVKRWEKKCPIKKLEKQMLNDKIITKEEIENMKKKIGKEIDDAVIFAKNSPFPKKTDLLKYVYSK